MANDNDLRIVIYSSGTTALDAFEYAKAQDLVFRKGWPGGIFTDCSFFLPGDPTNLGRITQKMRLVVYNGFRIAWEGRITNRRIGYNETTSGIYIDAVGYWGDVLLARRWRKWWADTRVSNEIWIRQSQASDGEDLWLIEQDFGYVHITPRSGSFVSGDYIALRYTSPTGETVKRITYDYSLKEDVQAWEMQVYNVGTSSAIAASQVTSTGTGSHDITLATPSQAVELRMYSRGNQNADINKYVHAQWNNLVVYSETSNINLTEIAADVRAEAADLSTDTSLIGSNTFSLVPFISEVDTLGDILLNAAAFGDASFNSWAVSVIGSDKSTDGLPPLKVAQYPALTDYELAVRLDEVNVVGGFEAEQDISTVANWVAVGYNDVSGRTVYVTPDDDANLKDATSITAYGERHAWITVDTTSTTGATNAGRAYLAKRKDPQWIVSSGIQLKGTVRQKNGSPLPVSLIEPGTRIKVENYLNDLNGTGLTLIITAVDYSDADQIASLSVGQPDNLDILLARIEANGPRERNIRTDR